MNSPYPMHIQFLYTQNMFSIWLSKELVPTLPLKMTILFTHMVQYTATPKEVPSMSILEIPNRIHPTMIKVTASAILPKQFWNSTFSLKYELQKEV